jgi:hypothetical protein
VAARAELANLATGFAKDLLANLAAIVGDEGRAELYDAY